MVHYILFIAVIAFSSNNWGAEAPAPMRWMPPTPQQEYVAGFKTHITPLAIAPTEVETDGMIESRQYHLSKEPGIVHVFQNLQTKKALMISQLEDEPRRTTIISDRLEEIRATGASENYMHFLVSRKADAQGEDRERKVYLKQVNIHDGTVKEIPLPQEIPHEIHSIVYHEKGHQYFLAGQQLGCANSEYLFRFDESAKTENVEEFFNTNKCQNVNSMHLLASGSLITTHHDRKIKIWEPMVEISPANHALKAVTTSEILLEFNGEPYRPTIRDLGIPTIKSALSTDQKKLLIAVNKAIKPDNNFIEQLVSKIVIFHLERPKLQDEILDPFDTTLITDLKALNNEQLVCARVKQPKTMPVTNADFIQWRKGPHKSVVQLWDTTAKTMLLEFMLRERITHLAADDNNQRLLIHANNHEVRMPSFKVLDAMPEAKARALLALAKDRVKKNNGHHEQGDSLELFVAATSHPEKIMLPSKDNAGCLEAHEPHEIEMKLDEEQRRHDEKKIQQTE